MVNRSFESFPPMHLSSLEANVLFGNALKSSVTIYKKKLMKNEIDSGGHHLSTVNMIEALRLEQENTEAILAKIEKLLI